MARLFAATGESVVRLDEEGGTWSATHVLEADGAQCLAVDPHARDRVFAGLREGGVRRSDDGGLTWVTKGLFQGTNGGGTRPWISVSGTRVAVGFIGSWRWARAQAKKPIVIGLTCDATGTFADSGQADRRGMILAIEEQNARGGVLGVAESGSPWTRRRPILAVLRQGPRDA